MQYLLDSDWAIQSLRGVEIFRARIRELTTEGLAISVVSVGEIYEGVIGSHNPDKDEFELLEFLRKLDVLEIDLETARTFGRERQRLRLIGQMIGPMDILIAATAIQHDLTLLTNNVSDFSRIAGLKIESL